MNAICLVIDRLQAGYLGAYGNSWVDTPAADRLAAESLVFDHASIQSPRLEDFHAACWQGWHALCPTAPPENRPSLAELVRRAGVTPVLLTDEPRLAGHAAAIDFDELLSIDPPWQPRPAERIEETHAARCVVQILDWLESAREPFLLWCHLAGLGHAWDAPVELREALREPGDPAPYDSADVPERRLDADHDPDDLLPLVQAYSAQVSVLDTCLGALLESLRESRQDEETLLVLAGARGFPLGEHRRVGPCDEALYGELVHVPLMLRVPGREGDGSRSHALVEPADLWATLLEWWGIEDHPVSPTASSLLGVARDELHAPRDRLCLRGREAERAVRTPAWYLRLGGTAELFAKPDDRWEANDVAVRCGEVAECLGDSLAQFVQALRSGSVAELPPLSSILLEGLE